MVCGIVVSADSSTSKSRITRTCIRISDCEKDAYVSAYGWNVDHKLPKSGGGKTADYNPICCHILLNDEKMDKFLCFKANEKHLGFKGDRIILIIYLWVNFGTIGIIFCLSARSWLEIHPVIRKITNEEAEGCFGG